MPNTPKLRRICLAETWAYGDMHDGFKEPNASSKGAGQLVRLGKRGARCNFVKPRDFFLLFLPMFFPIICPCGSPYFCFWACSRPFGQIAEQMEKLKNEDLKASFSSCQKNYQETIYSTV